MIDLHTHSTASDGSLTPAQLVQAADRIGLSAVALTDHDTTAGISEFVNAAEHADVTAVTGVELAASWYGASLHIIGLFIDVADARLQRLLAEIRGFREQRNVRILERLAELGKPVDTDLVRELAGDEVTGRPHIAAALVQSGHCASSKEAFSELIGKSQPAYFRRHLPLPGTTIAAIHTAGGVAVWAHPVGMRELPQGRLRHITRKLKECGLDGVETYYSEYSAGQQDQVARLSREYDLLPCGGSDFHGVHTPEVRLGVGKGNLAIPDSLVEPLRKRAGRYRGHAWSSER